MTIPTFGVFLAISTAVAGCAATSGIIPVGPDIYTVSELRAPVRGGGAEAQRIILSEAAAFCQQQGRTATLLDLRPAGDPRGYYWPSAFDATFQCRPAGGVAQPVAYP